jgi:hypothetical protein
MFTDCLIQSHISETLQLRLVSGLTTLLEYLILRKPLIYLIQSQERRFLAHSLKCQMRALLQDCLNPGVERDSFPSSDIVEHLFRMGLDGVDRVST